MELQNLLLALAIAMLPHVLMALWARARRRP